MANDFDVSYIQLACEALIPPLIHNGVAFEAHAQNVLARFDVTTGRLLGFVIRDLGGLRVHPPTLVKSIGTEFKFLEGHCVATATVEETYPKFYHTFINNHIQRLIRVLGMHYDGSGWDMLRRRLKEIIPADHGLYKAWLDPSTSSVVPGKCLMRMRLQGAYRDVSERCSCLEKSNRHAVCLLAFPQPHSLSWRVCQQARRITKWKGFC